MLRCSISGLRFAAERSIYSGSRGRRPLASAGVAPFRQANEDPMDTIFCSAVITAAAIAANFGALTGVFG